MHHFVAIALGSNIGDAQAHIREAFQGLQGFVENARLSSLYESAPMYFTDQATFVNAVAIGQTQLAPQDLLHTLKEMERDLGRTENFRNGPRVIDLDILFYDDLMMEEADLTIPHPRMAERPFVMVPLAELTPDFVHPTTGKTVADMKDALTYSEGDLHVVA